MADSTPLAFSYVRFSTPEPIQGDSLRRQTEATEAWCVRNKVRLDTSTRLHDLGKSAFTGDHRKNPDRNALAGFLKLVESGKIPRGSFLVVENLDRLSREHIQPALLLVLSLTQAGIRIVQLRPTELVFDDKSDTLPVMMMMVELSRGHSESAMKSERIGGAWKGKKEAARKGAPQPTKKEGRVNGMAVLTHALPLWVEERGGRAVPIPGRAAVVKKIFALAAAGYGRVRIAQKLREEEVPPFARPLTEADVALYPTYRKRAKKEPPTAKETRALRARLGALGRWHKGEWAKADWRPAYIGMILTDRRARGEYTPDGRKGGERVPGYFPEVVGEAEWLAAKGEAARRRRRVGAVGGRVELFSGLLKDARSGESYFVEARNDEGGRRRVLRTAASIQGRGGSYAFPVLVFERALLGELGEIDAHEVLNGDREPDESALLAGQLEHVRQSIRLLIAEMEERGESKWLFDRYRAKEAEEKDLQDKLAEAQQKAAHPVSASWGEAQGLIKTLETAPDPLDARTRLRAALQRIVQSILVLVVHHGRDRWLVAQVYFSGKHEGRRRTYVIYYRGPRGNGRSHSEAATFSHSVTEEAGSPEGLRGLDLRKPADVAKALRDSEGWMADIYAVYLKTVADAVLP
jgi:DNA invertase Pin-like site-specific DNA recombinase